MEELTSPLFDVVSEKQRNRLYQHPYNSIHLSVPAGENPSTNAAQLLEKWKNEGILLQDTLPAIYVYYQYFSLPGSTINYCRKGFICHIKAYDWSENVILRHENTIPSSVNDRIELLTATLLHVALRMACFLMLISNWKHIWMKASSDRSTKQKIIRECAMY
jgi:uncharacterized protein (DUF1015 family)